MPFSPVRRTPTQSVPKRGISIPRGVPEIKATSITPPQASLVPENIPPIPPDDFPDAEQAGKTKTARVVLNDVKRKSVPTLDDAMARELGDFETVDALKSAVRTDMSANAEREADAAAALL